jgi:hypothetical protein
VPLRPGASPAAFLAFPLPSADEPALRAANLLVSALDGDAGWLDRALSGLATASSVRVLGAPRAPALVVRIAAPQASLDPAVQQTRALFERLRSGAVTAADLDRALARHARAELAKSLDPRARLVSTWRGTSLASPVRVTLDELRDFAQRALTEETMVVVAARPARPVPP